MFNAIFSIVITPIVQILEFFYTLIYEITDNEGIAVIGLSFVVTLFTLPLYMVAETWQDTERKIQDKLSVRVKKIKAAFKGDEQYMMLGVYYKQNHYHPLMALRSSFSIIIQVPFFMAAYSFLSNLPALKGVSFLFVRDFGNPDATFKIGSFAINVLPIAMTLINIVSGAIYSKGHKISEKLQIFGMAAIFLVLLYNSPAGLVVYWTMNNILSLVKNIFYKLKNPKKVLYIILCLFSAFLVVFGFCVDSKKVVKIVLVFLGLFLPCVPYLIGLWNKFVEFVLPDEGNFPIFIFSAIVLALTAGFAIPSMLIESEPVQFSFVENVASPFVFLRATFYQAFGFFILWPVCLYFLFSKRTKKGFAVLFSVLAVLGMANTFLFSEDYGPITAELYFMTEQTFMPTLPKLLLNIAVLVVLSILVVLALKKIPKIYNSIAIVFILSLFTIGIKNSVSINSAFKKMEPPITKEKVEPMYHLSKTEKNVVVIMQDRLFMPYINDVFAENPNFSKQFDGFTFYRNAISMGHLTMLGSVGIFGGYDFTPYEINKRDTETIQSKHNKALLTMPVLFHDAGYDVYVSGLPYENFFEYPITNMYKDYPYVNRQETRGMYSDLWYKEHNVEKVQYIAKLIKRNFIWFSLFKMLPPVARRYFYHGEWWLSYSEYDEGFPRFLDNYSELEYLPLLFDAESEKGSLVLIANETTHEPIVMQAPDYLPWQPVEDFDKGSTKNAMYCTTYAVIREFAKFFEYLKNEGIYDNTKIIIVSDHGASTKDADFTERPKDILPEDYVCTIFVKEFGSHGDFKEDMTFMTNADTPYLATKNVIENAKNPFTGNPLEVEDKNDYVKISSATAQSTRIRNDKKYLVRDDEWFTVCDDIYKAENWKWLKSGDNSK